MKITTTTMSGTPAEFAELTKLEPDALARLTGHTGEQEAPPTDELDRNLGPDLAGFIKRRAGTGPVGDAMRQFAVELMGWGALPELSPSTSEKSPDGFVRYIRFYVPGPRHVGAFAYLFPKRGVVHLRLPESAATGLDFAVARKVTTSPNKVSVQVRPDSLTVALKLAREAFDQGSN